MRDSEAPIWYREKCKAPTIRCYRLVKALAGISLCARERDGLPVRIVADRDSTDDPTSFLANQVRLLLHGAAYWLLDTLRHCPLDADLRLTRDSLSPVVRRLACRFGALLPFREAAHSLAQAARTQLSASTLRIVTEAVGARREQHVAAAITTGWTDRLTVARGAPPDRLNCGDGQRAHPGHVRGGTGSQGRPGGPGA